MSSEGRQDDASSGLFAETPRVAKRVTLKNAAVFVALMTGVVLSLLFVWKSLHFHGEDYAFFAAVGFCSGAIYARLRRRGWLPGQGHWRRRRAAKVLKAQGLSAESIRAHLKELEQNRAIKRDGIKMALKIKLGWFATLLETIAEAIKVLSVIIAILAFWIIVFAWAASHGEFRVGVYFIFLLVAFVMGNVFERECVKEGVWETFKISAFLVILAALWISYGAWSEGW